MSVHYLANSTDPATRCGEPAATSEYAHLVSKVTCGRCRTLLGRSTPERKSTRTPVRGYRSTKRRRAAPQESSDWWTEATDALLRRSGGRCEVGGCDLYATGIERHHRVRRRDGGDRLSNLLALCPQHHQWVTANPTAARAAGYIVLTTDDPAEVPVRIGGHLWRLDDHGQRHVQP